MKPSLTTKSKGGSSCGDAHLSSASTDREVESLRPAWVENESRAKKPPEEKSFQSQNQEKLPLNNSYFLASEMQHSL